MFCTSRFVSATSANTTKLHVSFTVLGVLRVGNLQKQTTINKLTCNFSVHLHSHSNAVFPWLWYKPYKSCFYWISNAVYYNCVVVFVPFKNLRWKKVNKAYMSPSPKSTVYQKSWQIKSVNTILIGWITTTTWKQTQTWLWRFSDHNSIRNAIKGSLKKKVKP